MRRQDKGDFMNRVVLVTGASRGIGAAIAKTFLEDGDVVYINYNKSEKEALELAKNYEKAKTIKCDVTNEQEIDLMINEIKAKSGQLDVLVNNAGIAIDTTLEDKTKDNFRHILDVNLLGPFLVSKAAIKVMSKGSIINIASTNGIDTYYSYSLDYDASKAGLINMTHNLAVLLAPNIRVNAVAPGWVMTDMNKELDQEQIADECNNILLKRFAEPQEIADVVFFLASDKAKYIDNTVIRVDGGLG